MHALWHNWSYIHDKVSHLFIKLKIYHTSFLLWKVCSKLWTQKCAFEICLNLVNLSFGYLAKDLIKQTQHSFLSNLLYLRLLSRTYFSTGMSIPQLWQTSGCSSSLHCFTVIPSVTIQSQKYLNGCKKRVSVIIDKNNIFKPKFFSSLPLTLPLVVSSSWKHSLYRF